MFTVKIKTLIISVLIPLAVGGLSALISMNAMDRYADVVQPSFAPPAVLFPIVWTVLYILMGISSYMVFESKSPNRKKALETYAVQLAANFLWSIIFFNLGMYLLAFLWLILLFIITAVMTVKFYRIKPAAGFLQIPYVLWLVFAGVLNWFVFMLN